MDFIFRWAEEFLKKHKRIARYRRVFAVIAAVVVFATTYELILPAITMDKGRAADTPGIEVGIAADAEEEEVSSGAGAAAEEERDDKSASGKEEKAEEPVPEKEKKEEPAPEKEEKEESAPGKEEKKEMDKSEDTGKEDPEDSSDSSDHREESAREEDSGRSSSDDEKEADEKDEDHKDKDQKKIDDNGPDEGSADNNSTESVNDSEDEKDQDAYTSENSHNDDSLSDDGRTGDTGSESSDLQQAEDEKGSGDNGNKQTENGSKINNQDDSVTDSTSEIAADAATDEITDEAAAAATEDQLTVVEPVAAYPATIVFEGKDYTITATFDEKAKLPADVKLDVVEILPDVIYKDENGDPLYPAYEEYYEKTLKALEKEKRLEDDQTVTTARFFDINFVDSEGHTFEPAAPVSIAVKYREALSAVDTADTMAVHFDVDKKKDKTRVEVIDTQTEVKKKEIKEISFEAEKFSVYGVIGTEIITTQYLTADGEKFNISVTYPSDAGIPEEAKLEVSEILRDSDDYDNYLEQTAVVLGMDKDSVGYARFFDITITDRNGTKVQPAAGKTVDVKIELADAESDSLSVVHFGEQEEIVEATGTKTEQGAEISFSANSFSIYAIIDDSGTVVTPRRTYQFFDVDANDTYAQYNFYNKNGEYLHEQIAKNGDILDEIPDPYHSGKVFHGWFIWNEEDGTFGEEVSFDTAQSGITEDQTVKVYAKYDNVYYVNFHENGRSSSEDIIQTTKITDTSGNILISDVIAPQADETHIFYGWEDGTDNYSIYDENKEIKTTAITVSENTNLYPYFEEAHWLHFVSGETGSRASYVPAQFVLTTETITELPVPTRPGYEFDGWYTGSMNDDGTIGYGSQVSDGNGTVIDPSSGMTLTENMTLYGHWSAKDNATYTVVIWKQKVTDDKNASDSEKTYDYEASYVRTGVTDAAAGPDSEDISKNFSGFHYSRTVQTSTTIKADGSTVVNVYYDRDLMAVNFYYKNGDQPSGATTAYTYTRTTSNNTSPQQYGVLEDGTYIELTRDAGTTETRVYYTYGNFFQTEYSGTFYTKRGNDYTASEYSGSNLPPESDHTTYYARVGGFFGDNYYELTRQTQTSTEYHWTYTRDGVTYPYTGTRYTRSTMNSYPYMVTWTGLSGQPFDKYDYEWPSSYSWNESSNGTGTTQTFQTGFTQTSTPYNLYDQGAAGTSYIYHYKQALDGKYYETEGNRYTARGTGGSFHFQNKFDGFTVNSYNTGNNGFNTNGGSNTNMNNTPSTYPLHVYHTRNKWRIDYKSPDEAGNFQTVHTTGDNAVYYEQPLDGYNLTLAQAGLSERDHYEFTGWYADETCTSPFDFTSTMPNANLAVYAGWKKVWYQIIVDPDGGEITPNIGSTYFWKQYEDTFDEYAIQRNYIEDPAGTYKYVYFDGHDDPDGNITTRTATYLPAEEGYTGTRYRLIDPASDPTYTLIGWYVVDENGETTDTPYDFTSQVEGPVTIRAVWRLSGAYKLVYNPTSEVNGKVVSGTFTQDSPDEAFADAAEIVVQPGPSNITPLYIFDGWEIVDQNGNVLDDNNGAYYQPGEVMTLNAARWARNKLVHIRAHYTKVDESNIPVPVSFIKYDANGGETSVEGDTEETEHGYVTVENNVVTISKLHINEALVTYGDSDFSRDGYVLKGWNHVKAEADAGNVEFSPGQKIGVDNLTDETNTLYAVWEIRYKVTVKKVVVSNLENDKTTEFIFTPSTTLDQDGTTFKLKDTETKEFDNISPGTVITVTESGNDNFTVSATMTATTQEDRTPIPEEEQEAVTVENGGNITVNSDLLITVTNTRSKQTVKIFKTDDSEEPVPLDGVGFTLNGQTLTTGQDGFTGTLTLNTSNTAYKLKETTPKQHYTGLTGEVDVTVGSSGVTIPIGTENVSISNEPDDNGVYTITVVNPRERYNVTLIKNVIGTDADKDAQYSFTAAGLEPASVTVYGRKKKDGENVTQNNSAVWENIPYGTVFSISENDTYTDFETSILVSYADGTTSESGALTTDELTLNGNVTITFTNKRNRVPLKVVKTDQSGIALAGAAFTGDLIENGRITTTVTGEGSSAEAVIIENSSVKVGTYTISEEDAPPGFIPLKGTVEIAVQYDENDDITVSVTNNNSYSQFLSADRVDVNHPEQGWIVKVKNDAGLILPYTGGPTGIPRALGGILIVSVAALMYIFIMGRRERRLKDSL